MPTAPWNDKREKPWSEDCAVAELRWWEDQVRRGEEPKMPSRRFLEERFPPVYRTFNAQTLCQPAREAHPWTDSTGAVCSAMQNGDILCKSLPPLSLRSH